MPTRFEILQSTSDTIIADFAEYPVTVSGELYDYNGAVLTALTSSRITLGQQITISGSCGYSAIDDRQLLLATASGLNFNDTYRARNTKGQLEEVQVMEKGQGYIITDRPLAFDYATGDVLEEPSATYTLTQTETSLLGENYRCRLVGLLPSGKRQWNDIVFDVVAHKIEQPITPKNLRNYWPQAYKLAIAEEEGTDLMDLLSSAWESVKNDLRNEGIKPYEVMNEDQLKQLQLYKLKRDLCEMGYELLKGNNPVDALNYFNAEYVKLFSATKQNLQWVDKDQDLKPSEEETRKRQPRHYI